MDLFNNVQAYYAVIGDPISQSMSPDIHNACLQKLHIQATYKAIHVPAEQLGTAVEQMIQTGCLGFNVTIPHKLSIMKYLDEIDPYAEAIGAVNTVLIQNGRMKGFNTDGPGFYQSLILDYQEDLKKANILVLGAGGAARAIVKTFLLNDVHQVSVANRTMEKAIELMKGSNGEVLTPKEAEGQLGEYDIVINTTPIGMFPNPAASPIDTTLLDQKTTLVDIIYNPLTTEFLKLGIRKGCTVQNGVPMFIHQAALAFELWTGEKPDLLLMEQIVKQKLGGNTTC
ncbi:shikimate dehydrogenase [Pseudalkalibacillus berkeleyi]|uniref:Shikimate dehydrogenase (NADP(+)) n=1 Tax=Pseudalkalibacillus berkeleyi TaxID=1069813 RepID=A0ABS9H256_9BACL|nr:shikimate dehydrogenase [Pseudalkalibacillus berkeleyi]MCF6137999.1 shikimate dehydrogenase [Pseudalkalibacillus berkeleyi]